MTIFVISDTHFGHEKILQFKTADGSNLRTFSCVEEMDEYMVERWNSVVTPSDIVYHLGDVYFGKGHVHLSRLNGKKRLVLGNHDNVKAEALTKNFQKILLWRMFPEHNCLLTHLPVHKSTLYKVRYNLHGHVHRNSLEDRDYINCSTEVLDYTPTPLEELVNKE